MGTLKEKLEYINKTKNEIKKSIRSKGVSVDDSEPFSSYSDKIHSIPVYSNLSVSPFTITKNGEYESDAGVGYNPVIVKVQPNIIPKTITAPGTYKAEDDHCDGYGPVTVNIQSGLKTLLVNKTAIGEKPEKKSFKIEDEEESGALGYDKIAVNFDGMCISKEEDIDESKFGIENTYVASEDGAYGYNHIHIKIVGNEGPYTVRYWNEGSRVYEETVEKGSNGTYSVPPVKKGYQFAGWSPLPMAVTRNMDCYATFVEEPKTDDGEAGGISQDWEEIAKTGGADIKIGDHLTIYGGEVSYDNDVISYGWSAPCTKIGDHADLGSTSTWAFPLNISGRFFKKSGLNSEGGPLTRLSFQGWSNSDLRNGLMPAVLSSIKARTDKKYQQSAAIASAIKTVSKSTYQYVGSEPWKGIDISLDYDEVETSDTLFIPSFHEAKGSNAYEKTGPVYQGGGSSFFRTSFFTGEYNYRIDSEGHEVKKEGYESIGLKEPFYEYGSFAVSGNGFPLNGYVYVNQQYNEIWKGYHPGQGNYWDQTYPPAYTQQFSTITICFCI